MCGICGKYNPTGVKSNEIEAMLQAIAHRGPDDEGYHLNGSIGLGNRRLSIIDLPGGHQPISNEDHTIWLVFNGEIYNFKSLRNRLEAKGHQFRTNTDTEVILHLYEEYGDRCVEHLNGMFAFAIWDEPHQKLLLARDRLGQKPLFYSQEGDGFLFGSELKAILAVSGQAREIDYEAVHHYLSLRFIPPPHTMLGHIKKLPPAHILVFQQGQVSIFRYWDINFSRNGSVSEVDLLDRLDERLNRTVKSHMISDVPVGAFLSGGMDSSMIVALMAKNFDKPFNTFAIGVAEQDFNELPYAKMVADAYQTRHIERIVEANLVHLLPKMIWHLDEPSDPIAACQYQAAELAAQHVKVVLGGDGGDELFAGFDRYMGLGYINYYRAIPAYFRRLLVGSALSWLPESFAYKSVTQKLRWMHQLSTFDSVSERYAEATSFFRFSHSDKEQLYGGDLWSHIGHLRSAQIITEPFNRTEADNLIDRMLYADFVTRLPEHSLMLTDRLTMAHGLEARSPFLDHELVEFMAKVPASFKIRGRELKYILRKLAVSYLPEKIINRPKQGFMFPVAYWFRHQLYDFIKQALLNSFFIRNGVFHRSYIIKLLEEHRANRVDHHVRLWMLLNLEIWHQIYIEQNDVAFVSENISRLHQPRYS